MNEEVPEGWARVPISELLSDLRTGPFGSALHESDYIEGAIPVINPSNFADGKVRPSALKTVNRATFERLKEYALREGDIILARRGEMGRCALVTASETGWLCGTGSAILRLREGLLPEFIQVMISSPGVRSYLSDASVGTTMDNLNQRMFREMPILLPPLAEQRRLLERVSALVAKIRSSQERLEKIPAILKRFRKAVVESACTGKLTADWREQEKAPHWEQATLGEIVQEKPKNGYSAKPVKSKTAYRVLTLTATTSGRFDSQQFKYFDEPIPKESPFWLRRGDILIQRGNTIEYVGVPAIYDGPDRAFIYPDLMMRVRANEKRITTHFLWIALTWGQTRTYLRERATGTAGSMPKINQKTLIDVPIYLPSIAEQTVIVERANALFALADQLGSRHKKARAQVDRLAQSILAKAFRGELVPTEAELARREGRSYETAQELLARIQATSGNGAAARGPRKKRARA